MTAGHRDRASAFRIAVPAGLSERDCGPRHATTASGATQAQGRARERAMDSDTDDLSAMSKQDFLTEHKRVRETIDSLQERYQMLNAEFDRRAAAKWRSES